MSLELDISTKDAEHKDRVLWTILDLFFCIAFTAEILFRIYCLGPYDFLKQARYLADVILVNNMIQHGNSMVNV